MRALTMKKTVIMFDLGGTLVQYYERSEFPTVLEECIAEVENFLGGKGLLSLPPDIVRAKVREEDYESSDNRSRPLEERLTRIFGIDASVRTDKLLMDICRHFMKPVFARAHCYEDTLPALREVRSRGLRAAIVSNTSWGSPASLWREEIRRHRLDGYVTAIVFDRDVGWRKPAKEIFNFALKRLRAHPGECVFVGDEPKWDLDGPRSVGIDPILIDRRQHNLVIGAQAIAELSQLIPRLDNL